MGHPEWNATPIYPDGTAGVLAMLIIDPTADVRCRLHSRDPAVAIYYTPRGCAARSDDTYQPLCLQHIETDGISTGSRPILDLTADGSWSERAGLDLPLSLGYSAIELLELLDSINEQDTVAP